MKHSKTTKGAAYYLGLRYPVTLRELSEEDGGGYAATIPQLGSKTFVAVGETPSEALELLEELRQHLIPILAAEQADFPEPLEETSEIEQYSGSLMLRIPRGLHAKLVLQAKRNNCSLNKLATQLLAEGLSASTLAAEVTDAIGALVAAEVRKVLDSAVPVPRSSASGAWRLEAGDDSEQQIRQEYQGLQLIPGGKTHERANAS